MPNTGKCRISYASTLPAPAPPAQRRPRRHCQSHLIAACRNSIGVLVYRMDAVLAPIVGAVSAAPPNTTPPCPPQFRPAPIILAHTGLRVPCIAVRPSSSATGFSCASPTNPANAPSQLDDSGRSSLLSGMPFSRHGNVPGQSSKQPRSVRYPTDVVLPMPRGRDRSRRTTPAEMRRE
jgi:hypothetical protein